jgi:hypothetical protein
MKNQITVKVHDTRFDKSSGGPDGELQRAQAEAEHSRRRLEGSLNRLNTGIQAKVTDTAGNVDEKVHSLVDRVRDRLDTSSERLDHFVGEGQNILDGRLAQVDQFVKELGPQIDSSIDEVRGIVGRVQGSLSGTVGQLDEVVTRVESSVVGIRDDFMRTSDEVITRAEGVARNAQGRFSQGVSEVSRMIDMAEGILNDLSDPARIINRNPRVLVPALFVGGLLIGLFFRGYFENGELRLRGSSIRRFPGIPENGVVPQNEGSRKVA